MRPGHALTLLTLVICTSLLGAGLQSCVVPLPPTTDTSPPDSTPPSTDTSTTSPPGTATGTNDHVQAFYYTWYGDPTTDGGWHNWEQNGHAPPEDIGSEYYPQLGAYSSADTATLDQHMHWLADAGVGVIVVTWWGPGSYTDARVSGVLDAAQRAGIKVAWHIEPYNGRDAASIERDIHYLIDTYGSHPAFYRVSRPTKYGPTDAARPVFYVFESSGGPGAVDVASLRATLDRIHADPMYDSIVIGQSSDACRIDGCGLDKETHFDGLYTYDGLQVDGSNFASVATKIAARDSIFSPSVAPGYSAIRATGDTRVKPRTGAAGCSGYTYDCMWDYAAASGAEWISITSFNEWHEGSQIEPGVTKSINGYTYPGYGDLYLTKTREHIDSWSGGAPSEPNPVPTPTPTPAPSSNDVVYAVGDAACGAGSSSASCKQSAVADVIAAGDPSAFIGLGDLEYEQGSLSDFETYYDPTYGRFNDIAIPVVGNHEYLTSGAAGYYTYFANAGVETGGSGKGYYAADLPNGWRVYVINSNCGKAGGCGVGSPQETWLKADLAAHPGSCSILAAHHPYWVSQTGYASSAIAPLVSDFYDAGGDVMLMGHSHFYERFAPQDPSGTADPTYGMREFVVGTGGRNVYQPDSVAANSEVRNGNTFGALELTLHDGSYSWRFVPIAGQSFTDAGSGNCHDAPPAGYVPSGPGTGSGGSGSSGGSLVPPPDHIVIVIDENHPWSSIIGSSSAPYINSLANSGALFTQSFAIEHPSQPNYLDLFSGSNQGVTDDSCPHTFTTDNLASQLLSAGYTYGIYSENLPSVGSTTCSHNGYARKHNPSVNWPSIPSSTNMPFSGSFPTDFTTLPTVSFVIPTLANDMHDGTIAQGDAWLQTNLDAYAQWAMTHNSLLIFTFDEGSGSNQQIVTFFYGQNVKPGQYSEHIDHFDVLRTIEDMYNLSYAGAAASATPITQVWIDGGSPYSGSSGGSGTTSGGSSGSPSGTVSGNTITFTPTDDTYVRNDNPASNYGSAATLQVDGSPALKRLLLKFDVTGLSGTSVQRAVLRLYDVDSAATGGNFSLVSNSWNEGSVAWNTAPAPGARLDEPTHLHVDTSYDVDVTSAITGDGTYSFMSTSLDANGADFSSKEGTVAPQLIITTS